MSDHEIALRYGCNPHQAPARARALEPGLPLPFRVLNGSPGYINLLDALNSWSLVRDLGLVTGEPAAASFKHVSPAGAAVGRPLDATDRRAFFVPEDEELSPLACAYARARGADRVSSFGDWIALNQPVDLPTARLIRREVSDGVVAPGFEEGAFELLAGKKGGKYPVIEMDAGYRPSGIEARDVGGVRLEQPANAWTPDEGFPGAIVSTRRDLDDATRRDLIVATVALKYVQSNSVVLAKDGQVIGAGAGQQSRIHCTRLACEKADGWWLRRHPRVLELPFAEGIKRPARDNAIDQFLLDHQAEPLEQLWLASFSERPTRLTAEEKRAWIEKLAGVSLSSDAFFPFRDSIDRAGASGVAAIVHPGGSIRDEEVTGAADEYAMLLAHSGTRLFTH